MTDCYLCIRCAGRKSQEWLCQIKNAYLAGPIVEEVEDEIAALQHDCWRVCSEMADGLDRELCYCRMAA